VHGARKARQELAQPGHVAVGVTIEASVVIDCVVVIARPYELEVESVDSAAIAEYHLCDLLLVGKMRLQLHGGSFRHLTEQG
jgi:hypothetical protein